MVPTAAWPVGYLQRCTVLASPSAHCLGAVTSCSLSLPGLGVLSDLLQFWLFSELVLHEEPLGSFSGQLFRCSASGLTLTAVNETKLDLNLFFCPDLHPPKAPFKVHLLLVVTKRAQNTSQPSSIWHIKPPEHQS